MYVLPCPPRSWTQSWLSDIWIIILISKLTVCPFVPKRTGKEILSLLISEWWCRYQTFSTLWLRRGIVKMYTQLSADIDMIAAISDYKYCEWNPSWLVWKYTQFWYQNDRPDNRKAILTISIRIIVQISDLISQLRQGPRRAGKDKTQWVFIPEW